VDLIDRDDLGYRATKMAGGAGAVFANPARVVAGTQSAVQTSIEAIGHPALTGKEAVADTGEALECRTDDRVEHAA
jgi:hypothetical protein